MRAYIRSLWKYFKPLITILTKGWCKRPLKGGGYHKIVTTMMWWCKTPLEGMGNHKIVRKDKLNVFLLCFI